MHGGWEHILGNMLFLWMFGSDLATEFRLAEQVFGLSAAQLAQIRQNAWDHRFKK